MEEVLKNEGRPHTGGGWDLHGLLIQKGKCSRGHFARLRMPCSNGASLNSIERAVGPCPGHGWPECLDLGGLSRSHVSQGLQWTVQKVKLV